MITSYLCLEFQTLFCFLTWSVIIYFKFLQITFLSKPQSLIQSLISTGISLSWAKFEWFWYRYRIFYFSLASHSTFFRTYVVLNFRSDKSRICSNIRIGHAQYILLGKIWTLGFYGKLLEKVFKTKTFVDCKLHAYTKLTFKVELKTFYNQYFFSNLKVEFGKVC